MIHTKFGGVDIMMLGYARGTTKYSLKDQLEKLEPLGCKKVFSDEDILGQDGLEAMLDYAREGDIVIVIALHQLARSIQDLAKVSNELNQRGIDLISLKEDIDTTRPEGNVVFKIIGAVGDFERELITERVRTGIQTARKNGVKLGRKSANKDQKEKAFEMYAAGVYTMKEITEATALSRATIYRYIEQKKAGE